jgi:hypothetical protein
LPVLGFTRTPCALTDPDLHLGQTTISFSIQYLRLCKNLPL